MAFLQWISTLKFDANGLIPVIVQDFENNQVLMFAFMNTQSLLATIETGWVTFYSRSRQKLWRKGESSGHTQKLKELFYDCDADCLLVKVEQNVAACHTGYRSCFFNRVDGETLEQVGVKLFDENQIYKN